jgi:hypothetical protein
VKEWNVLTWDQFRKDVQTRFLLPVTQYLMRIDFVEVSPTAQRVAAISDLITAGAVEAVRSMPQPDLAALKLHQLQEPGLVRVTYGHPVFSFFVELGKNHFILSKPSCSLEELTLTVPLLEAIADQLFSKTTKNSLIDTELLSRSYQLSHKFSQYLTLGSRLTDESQSPTNLDVMPFFVSMGEPASSVLSLLQPEKVIRGDAKFSFYKTIAGKLRNLWIIFEGPWNVTQRDISFQFEVRLHEGEIGEIAGGIELDDFRDFETPLLAYRDFVLKRIYPHIFHDIQVFPKITR